MKGAKWKSLLVLICAAVLCFSSLQKLYASEGSEPAPIAEVSSTDLDVTIRKRAEWVDKDTGDAKITLQYSSNSGEVVSTKDMNIVLIQDKSGTMDSNYGYNLEKARRGWEDPIETKYYPIQNSYGWSESISDMEKEGTLDYEYRLHYKSSSTDTPGYNNGRLDYEDMHYTSPCQVDNHYYLLVGNDQGGTNIEAWTMVHGNNLGGITYTDLHHYVKLDSREEALEYLAKGRRVIRQLEGSYYNEEGEPISITDENGVYFLDISEVHQYEEGWILSTCASTECQTTDRLSMSQSFYSSLVDEILSQNTYNKIAYVPFWGDVPDNGRWENLNASEDNTGLTEVIDGNQMSYKEGVTKLDFTTDAEALKEQINNNFTYRGTNWSRAFQNTIDFLENRSAEDQAKETLVIFLTDGNPQGYAGLTTHYDNPEINGVAQVQELKAIDGVTVFACGVGVSLMSDTGLANRLYAIDEEAVFARNQSEFDTLAETIINRIGEKYYINIDGVDAFYTDKLSNHFNMDTSKLDSSWRVLSSASSGTTKGVPTNVYNAVVNSSTVNKVYVTSTRTVYWYIGDMTNGSYTSTGHTMTFNIKYPNYQISTSGSEQKLATNTTQTLSYYTTQNTNRMKTVSITSPQLVFSRETSKVAVHKTLVGSSFATDQTFRFAYSKSVPTSGAAENVLGYANVVVKAGSATGSAVVSGLGAGTYYFYEVDSSNNIIHSSIQKVAISITPEISTRYYSASSTPWSVTNSDSNMVYNSKNVLKTTATNATVGFTNDYVRMEVKKVWEDSNSSYRPKSIMVDLLRNGVKVASKVLTEENNWEYTFENLPQYSPTGAEYDYTVSEIKIDGYDTTIEYAENTNGKTATITNKLMIADLTVTKVIKTNEIVWEHGNPLFIVKVDGIGKDGKEYTFYHTFEFMEDYVKENNDEVSLSHTFTNIPISSAYKIQEIGVSRYSLSKMEVDGYGSVRYEETQSGTEFYGIFASVDLEKKPEGTEVTLYNVKSKYQLLSHNAYLKNVIKE